MNGCHNGAISFHSSGITIDRSRCSGCFVCAENCPTEALAVKGKRRTVDELFKMLIKDCAYFGNEGGVTLSGGEPLIQADFASGLLRKLRDAGIDTAVDTAGNVPYAAFEKVLPFTDRFLYDIKLMDPARHKALTGADNKRILENLINLAHDGAKLWIRTPVIPGATDSEENISAIADFIHTCLEERIERWELCAFNNLCKSKYAAMGLDWAYNNAPLMHANTMRMLVSAAAEKFHSKALVSYTGAVQNQ
jgi:pyruvate formate lyase activating enzyme